MEEALGKLDISEEEATPLVIDDSDEGAPPKWLLAGKVLFRNLFHIQVCLFVLWERICLLLNSRLNVTETASGRGPHGTSTSTQ